MNEKKFFNAKNIDKLNNKPKYSLKKENIIPLTDLPETLSKRRKSLGWPMEIQGTGRIVEGTNDFEIRYPKGDIFLSFGVVLHELGHLRQNELSPELDKIDKENNYDKYVEQKEQDAYKRGLERAEKYFPEVLEDINKKFQKYKKQGKLKKFLNFIDLYNFLQGSIDINKALVKIEDIDDEEEVDKLGYEALKQIGIDKFFNEIKESRVNEKIDSDWIENFIIKMADKIAKE